MSQELFRNLSKRGSLIPEPHEEVLPKPRQVKFTVVGGTWWMKVDPETGTRRSPGGLKEGVISDQGLAELLRNNGVSPQNSYAERIEANLKSAQELYRLMSAALKATGPDAAEQLGTWAHHNGRSISNLIEPTELKVIYAGDSSNMDPTLLAPALRTCLDNVVANPRIPEVIGVGTDTGAEFTASLDALLFGAKVAPRLTFGANRPPEVQESDAPKNLTDALGLTGKKLRGANWVFDDHVYIGGDVTKYNPLEHEKVRLGKHKTFLAPHDTASEVKTMFEYGADADPNTYEDVPENHPARWATVEQLYQALAAVGTIDLGHQNDSAFIQQQLKDPSIKAYVVLGHGLGNANPAVIDDIEAAIKDGKLVIVLSRAIVSQTEPGAYAASIFTINDRLEQAEGEDGVEYGRPIDGGALTPAAAKALLTRVVLEERDSFSAQELVNRYLRERIGFDPEPHKRKKGFEKNKKGKTEITESTEDLS